MKSFFAAMLLCIFSFGCLADDVRFGTIATKKDSVIAIDLSKLEQIQDGSRPDLVWQNLNELRYLVAIGSDQARVTLFNTLLGVLDNTESVVDCDTQHPKYDVGYLLELLSLNAEIWDFLRKTDKKTCFRIQEIYKQRPALYRSEYDNPAETDICGVLFK